MALKVTYNHPHFDKGHEFSLVGVGIFKNGESRALTEDEERAFLQTQGIPIKEALSGNENFKVEGSPELPTKEVSEHKKALESISDTVAFEDDGPEVEPENEEGGEK
jgi:hypothetical protein